MTRAPHSKTPRTSQPPAVVQPVHAVVITSSTDSVHPSLLYAPPLATCRIRSPYGQRGRKFHTGLDLIQTAGGGDPVFSSREGVVEAVSHRGGYGRMVLIRHGDFGFTRYAHLRKVVVRQGQTVQQGETIGYVGSSGRASGPHLHFEILTPTQKTVDPTPFLFPADQKIPLAHPPVPAARVPLATLPPAIPTPQKVK